MKFTFKFMRRATNVVLKQENEDRKRIENENQLQLSEQRIMRRDDIIAGLYSKLYAREVELHAATERIREFQGNVNVKEIEYICNCCCECHSGEDPVLCTGLRPHTFCANCVNQQIKTAYRGQCSLPRLNISCFGPNCNHVISEYQLYRTSEGRALLCNYHFSNGIKHIIDLFNDIATELKPPVIERVLYKLMFMNTDGTFRGYECTKCGYGPLWHEHCDDLLTHHNQPVLNGRINNACPMCKHLFPDVSNMKPWNGESDGSNPK